MKKDDKPILLQSLDDIVTLSCIRGGNGLTKLEGAKVRMKIKVKGEKKECPNKV